MEAMGQWDKALAYYRKALELEPDNTAYRANYIRFREIQQKYRKSPPPGSSDAQERAGGTKGWRDRVQTP
jgi:tetratricopeptide (TPR) repeat protein